MERNKTVIFTAMENANNTRLNLKKGDKVKMNDRYYVTPRNRDEIFKVTLNPYMSCGSLVVSLERCCDGEIYRYKVDGLTRVEEE